MFNKYLYRKNFSVKCILIETIYAKNVFFTDYLIGNISTQNTDMENIGAKSIGIKIIFITNNDSKNANIKKP